MAQEHKGAPWAVWVHCNVCWCRDESKVLFTSCGHFVCDQCGEGYSTCRVCLTPCSAISISKALKTSVRDYFNDPIHLLQKSLDVVKFQVAHMSSLLTHYQDQSKLLQQARESGVQATELLKEYQKERSTLLENSRRQQEDVVALSMENKKLKEELRRLQDSAKISTVSQKGSPPRASQPVISQKPLIQSGDNHRPLAHSSPWNAGAQTRLSKIASSSAANLDFRFSEVSKPSSYNLSGKEPTSPTPSRTGSSASRSEKGNQSPASQLEEVYPTNSVRSPVVVRNPSLFPLSRVPHGRFTPSQSPSYDLNSEKRGDTPSKYFTGSAFPDNDHLPKRRKDRLSGSFS